MHGRTIEIYMPNGNPKGIKECEIKDSIVKAIYIPRSQINDIYINENSDLLKVGIYFLIGEQDELGKNDVYIGESEGLINRIKQHDKKKDWNEWNYVICFVSQNDNINKGHIKYLENFCYIKALEINKCNLKNGNIPPESKLQQKEKDLCMSFFKDTEILLSALSYPILEDKVIINNKNTSNKELIYCKGKGASAEGIMSEGTNITILKGSTANMKETASAGPWIIAARKKLLDKGILKQKGKYYEFIESYEFTSPSTAAAVVLGRRANGRTERKDINNTPIDSIKRS